MCDTVRYNTGRCVAGNFAGSWQWDRMANELLERSDEKQTVIAALSALAGLFLCCIALNTFVDPDIWHEMALFREALALGYLPLADQFAYTPTVYPSVHHEWGTGASSLSGFGRAFFGDPW